MSTLKQGPFSRVLLVKPTGSTGLAFALNPIPLGLESIAAYIRKDVEDVMIYDQFMEKRNSAGLARVLVNFRPDLVGFSLSATEHQSGAELMGVVKKYNPQLPIIAGGYHPSGGPEIVLNYSPADAVCIGEGEGVMRDLVAGMDWSEIPGIKYRDYSDGGEIVTNPTREFLPDLDAMPFPARELRKRRGYVYKNNLLLDRAFDQMEFGRGCHGKCTFCCEPYMSKGKQRYKSPARAMDEIRSIWDLHGHKPLRVLIGDPHILGQPRKVEELCDLLLAADLDITFQVMSRTDAIVKSPQVVEKMVRAGMISWELGVESPTQEDLDITQKHINLSTQNEGIAILRKLGAEALGTFVVGLPHHTKDFVKKFPAYAKEIGLAAAAFGVATPFPGTGYWDELNGQDLIFEEDWAKYDENHNVFYHPTMSTEEIEFLRNWCLARFWNLDAVLEQFRLDQVRVGKFRMPYKLPLFEFLNAVLKKLKFAVDAGAELSEDHDGDGYEGKAAKFTQHAEFMFDAWVDPHMADYFREHPMHEILDMRSFGKMFHGKRLEVVMEDRARKKCLFAMNVSINKEGIDTIDLSKKPMPGADFLLRVDLPRMFVDPILAPLPKLKKTLNVFSTGIASIKGIALMAKFALYGIKEGIAVRMHDGKK